MCILWLGEFRLSSICRTHLGLRAFHSHLDEQGAQGLCHGHKHGPDNTHTTKHMEKYKKEDNCKHTWRNTKVKNTYYS